MCTSTVTESARSTWLRAGLATALVDGLWAIVLSVGFYGSTVMRLWQGVAATLLGPSAFEGGLHTTLIGLLMHIGVAFTWSGLFLVLATRTRGIRQLLGSRAGVAGVAAVYGPFIWVVMSVVVIPLLLQRGPTINGRWFVQLLGHIPFVGLPIVASVSAGLKRR